MRGAAAAMSPSDHNKTLVILHSAVGAFFTVGLALSPWIIAQNFRRPEQIPVAILIFGLVFIMALLALWTAFGLFKRKRWARKLALVASVVLFPLGGYISIYTWWFMHSDGAKRMYGVRESEK